MAEFNYYEYLDGPVRDAVVKAGYIPVRPFGRTTGAMHISHPSYAHGHFATLDIGHIGYSTTVQVYPCGGSWRIRNRLRHFKFGEFGELGRTVNIKGVVKALREALLQALASAEADRQYEIVRAEQVRIEALNEPLVQQLLKTYGTLDADGETWTLPNMDIAAGQNKEGEVTVTLRWQHFAMSAEKAAQLIELLRK